MKKLLSVLLSIILIISICPLGVFEFTANAETEGDFKYSISNGEATITGLVDNHFTGDMEIPSTIGGYPVKTIGEKAFKSRNGITSVILSDSITTISASAFHGCQGMTSIKFGNSLKTIGNEAFYNCLKLASVALPDSIISIGNGAFNSCNNLQSITLGNGLKSMGDYAFIHCKNLVDINFPDSIISVGQSAFHNTAWLENQPDGLIYTGKVAYCYNGACLGNVIIKEGTASITSRAFYGKGRKSVTVPDSVISIGGFAFYGCKYLTTATIGNGVKSIGEYAFAGCDMLASMTIPDSVTSIGENVFFSCDGLESLDIGNGLTSISRFAFHYCTSLKSVTLPAGLKTIGGYAFSDCTALESVVFGGSLQTISERAFNACSALEMIFLPNGTKSISEYAFFGCTNLQIVKIPNSVVSIGSSAFGNCKNITSVRLPSSLTSLTDRAFSGCTSLERVLIPDSVKSIGAKSFDSCENIYYVYYTGSLEQQRTMSIENDGNSYLESAMWVYNYTPICTHDYIEVRNAKPACTENGYTGDIYCYDCGELLEIGEIIEMLGHDYKAVVIDPTCTTEGYTTYTCSRCKDCYIDDYTDSLGHTGGTATCHSKAVCTRCGNSYGEFDANNHTGGTEVRNAKSPTCTEAGYTGDTYCLGCGVKIATGEVVSKLGHDYNAVVTPPTCTEQGYTTYTCSRCSDSYVDDYTNATGHTLGEWLSDENNHWHICATCGGKFDEAAHTESDWITDLEPTNRTDGEKHKECTVCAQILETEVIPNTHIAGDINDDGKVNNKDLTRLFKYLSGGDVDVNAKALDMNRDGDVNNKDVTLLFQCLTGLAVEIY